MRVVAASIISCHLQPVRDLQWPAPVPICSPIKRPSLAPNSASASFSSNDTAITITVLTLLTLMREHEGYRLPFFLDEANALDRANLRAIVRVAEFFGFAPVLASPDGSDAPAGLEQELLLDGAGQRIAPPPR
jgi:hypothetical protein